MTAAPDMAFPQHLVDGEVEELLAEAQSPRVVDDAALDALASRICRAMFAIGENIKRYERTRELEITNIRQRYERMTEPLRQQLESLERFGAQLAEEATFPGKSKSRNVGYGTYGRRSVPEKVKVADQEAAVLWLETACAGSAIRVKVERSVDAKEAKPLVLAHLKETGEVPMGFTHEAEREESYIRPDPF